MKPASLLLLGLAFCGDWTAAGENNPPTFRVRPIQIVVTDKQPRDLNLAFGLWCSDPGFQIRYLAEGQNIAGYDSLEIESIKTPDGVDISGLRNGKRAYTVSYPGMQDPDVSSDGKYCAFSLLYRDPEFGQFGNAEKIAIKGRVKLFLGTKRAEGKVELDVANKKEVKAGPYTFQVKSDRVVDPDIYSATAPRPGISVEVTGPAMYLIETKFHEGKNDLQAGRVSAYIRSMPQRYYLPKPKSGKFTGTVVYWENLKEVMVPFGQ